MVVGERGGGGGLGVQRVAAVPKTNGKLRPISAARPVAACSWSGRTSRAPANGRRAVAARAGRGRGDGGGPPSQDGRGGGGEHQLPAGGDAMPCCWYDMGSITITIKF
jgi:hypothetical protein